MKIAVDLSYKSRDLFVGVELPLTEGASQVLIHQLPQDRGSRGLGRSKVRPALLTVMRSTVISSTF